MSDATQALAIAERIIDGDIEKATHTDEQHALRLTSRYLLLDHSPITDITSIQVGETTITADADDGYTFNAHHVLRKPGYEWPAGSIITVTYDTGWATAGAYPTEVTEALAALEAWLGTSPHTALTRTQVDDIVEVRDSASREPPLAAARLLRKWVRPNV